MTAFPTIRIARPSDNLAAHIPFYRDGLGLDILYQFEDHNGFDGVMIGKPGAPYHLEFTRAEGHVAGRAPTKDNLLIFYVPNLSEWQSAVARMQSAGFAAVPSFNPYWDNNGMTFEDADG